MRMQIAICAAGLSFAAAGAQPVVAEFSAGETPHGWTVENGEYRSPEYSFAVDRIELGYSGANAAASATLSAIPREGEETAVATFTAASTGASFDFPDTTDFRSFCIATANGMTLSSFSAYVSAATLDMPSGVAISNNTTGVSFDAYWSEVEGATGYKVYVWTNVVAGASAGTEVWKETFANAPAKTSTVNFKAEFTDDGVSEWTFEKAYASISNGAVRIGTTSDKGVLVSPPLAAFPETPLTLRVTAWRQTAGDGVDMPVGVVSGDVTNIVGVVELGDEAAAYHVALPELKAEDRIALFSPTNKASARAIIDDVAILSGYSEGWNEPSYIVNGLDIGNALSHSFAALPSVPVRFAVEAYGRRGISSAKTEAVEVDLSNPDKVAVLNACPLSSLMSSARTYAQNFDSLASLTGTGSSGVEWLNGTTLPYWQAYMNGGAASTFDWNKGTRTTGGLFALSENDRDDETRSFGANSTKDKEFSWGLSFTNDTDSTVALSSVSYSAQQWGFGNTTNQTMSVSAKVVDRLDWISAHTDGWTELAHTESTVYDGTIHDTPVSTPVKVDPRDEISIAPGQVLLLKWTVHSLKSGTPGMMGIDDVSVTFEPELETGFFIRLASVPRPCSKAGAALPHRNTAVLQLPL